jgi:POT family proton-dependent oligopeptide transporter
MGGKYLGDAGMLKRPDASPEALAKDWRNFYIALGGAAALIVAFFGMVKAGIINVTLVTFGQYTGVIVVSLVFVYFAYVILFDCKDVTEKKRVAVIAALFVGAAMFWSGFEQASTSLNLFANDLTDRNILGWLVPTTWFQSINALFIIIMAPVIGSLWVYLGSRSPSLGLKFAYGLILLGIGFLVLAWGSTFAEAGKVSPMWLVVTYFFHTIGELCLSPVGLSATTKLSPHRLVGQMMGIWFMGAALGNLIAGLVGGLIESLPTHQLFGAVAMFSVGCGVLFLLFAVPIRKLAAGVE